MAKVRRTKGEAFWVDCTYKSPKGNACTAGSKGGVKRAEANIIPEGERPMCSVHRTYKVLEQPRGDSQADRLAMSEAEVAQAKADDNLKDQYTYGGTHNKVSPEVLEAKAQAKKEAQAKKAQAKVSPKAQAQAPTPKAKAQAKRPKAKSA